MPDTVNISPPAEPGSPDESAVRPPSRKKVRAKKVSAKAVSAKPAKKGQASRTSKGVASSVSVKVGSDTIAVPKALATNLTSKDLKRLRAVFKRIRKRGKKRAAKKRGAKKR